MADTLLVVELIMFKRRPLHKSLFLPKKSCSSSRTKDRSDILAAISSIPRGAFWIKAKKRWRSFERDVPASTTLKIPAKVATIDTGSMGGNFGLRAVKNLKSLKNPEHK